MIKALLFLRNFYEVKALAKMIPNYIDCEAPRLNGERMVFGWLSDETIKGVVMHSLLQKNHRRKIIGEVDFLYISERGMLCIEVKGGQEIYRKDGEWYSIGMGGNHNLIKDPFRQSKDCMYAMKSYISDTYGKMSKEACSLIGYAVVFPECIFTGKGNDLMTEVMYDCRKEFSGFDEFIKKTFDFWQNQEWVKHNFVPEKLSDMQINKFTDLLRGDFFVVPSMQLEMQHINQQLLELTEEQYDALDITLSNKRVVIQGGAGTGKSLLAIEKARKLIASNKSVAYVCFNRNMARYVKLSLGSIVGSFIGTYHSLLQESSVNKDLYSKGVLKISNEFMFEINEVRQYDCIIVDEAQDLMYEIVWEVLSKFLVGGMEKGEWVLFMDPNQNIFNHTDEYSFAWEYLREVYAPAIIPLTKNCRNTEQIGRKISVVTLVPPTKHMKISGPNVVMKTYLNNKELISILRKELSSIISSGTQTEDIVILSKYKLENSGVSGVKSLCSLDIVEVEDIGLLKKRAINFLTIQSFKGLESKVVLLIDVDGFKSEQNRMLNYVAMSRAEILLYVFYEESKKDEYVEVTIEGQDLFS